VVDETERPFRRRLDETCSDMPLLEELRQVGATEYIMYPLPFLNRTRTAVISFATQRPRGFDPTTLNELEFAVNLLSPYFERYILRRIAIDLLDTYVGPHTGQRILDGQVDRGAAERIDAAIWFADLRGFTLLSEQSPIPEVLDHLNAWFGTIGEVLEAHGGEVLKFMGDAVLAIFPTSVGQDRATSCRNALKAAEEFGCRTEAENVLRRLSGAAPLFHGLALHVGEVAYGNVGAARRLDFTVIGPAVNRASRLLSLSKLLDQEVLVSDDLAREIDQPLVDLGCHNLRGVDGPQRVFTLPR
jgi:adenylate cyclase